MTSDSFRTLKRHLTGPFAISKLLGAHFNRLHLSSLSYLHDPDHSADCPDTSCLAPEENIPDVEDDSSFVPKSDISDADNALSIVDEEEIPDLDDASSLVEDKIPDEEQ